MQKSRLQDKQIKLRSRCNRPSDFPSKSTATDTPKEFDKGLKDLDDKDNGSGSPLRKISIKLF